MAFRASLRAPLLSALVTAGLTQSASAGHRNFAANGWAFGAGVYVGPTAYGGVGPAFGLYPIYYPGFYGNGFSAYGPPVPTYGAVPGVFGGYDQVFNRYPPAIGGATGRFARRQNQPHDPAAPPAQQPQLESVPAPVGPLPAPGRPQPAPGEELPAPVPVPVVTGPGGTTPVSTAPVSTAPVATTAEPPLADGPAFRIEVRVPEAARVFVDGKDTTQTGAVRGFASPPLNAEEVYTYSVRAEWDDAGGKHAETRSVTGKPGARPYVIDFLTR